MVPQPHQPGNMDPNGYSGEDLQSFKGIFDNAGQGNNTKVMRN